MRRKILSALSIMTIGMVMSQQPNGLLSVYNFDNNAEDLLKEVNGSL